MKCGPCASCLFLFATAVAQKTTESEMRKVHVNRFCHVFLKQVSHKVSVKANSKEICEGLYVISLLGGPYSEKL